MRITCRDCEGMGEVVVGRRPPTFHRPAEPITDRCYYCAGRGEREERPEELAHREAWERLLPVRCPDCGGAVETRHHAEGEPYSLCPLCGPWEVDEPTPVPRRRP